MSSNRRKPTTVASVLAVLVGAVVAGIGYHFLPTLRSITVTAQFDSAAGLYVDNTVSVLGMPVGRVRNITPRGSYVDVEFTVDGIRDTVNGLAGMPGRKVLVYVSDGLPATVGLEMYDVIQQKFSQNANTLTQFEFDMNSRYASIVQAAARVPAGDGHAGDPQIPE